LRRSCGGVSLLERARGALGERPKRLALAGAMVQARANHERGGRALLGLLRQLGSKTASVQRLLEGMQTCSAPLANSALPV
jgi:hypothetical protein